MPMTITEGLAEIKTINKRIEKKRQSVMDYLVRQDMVKDPLESQGGSRKFVTEERQAIGDLLRRIVQIRAAIQRVNASTLVTIGGEEKSIADWLVWRRECSTGHKAFLDRLRQTFVQARAAAQQKGVAVRTTDQAEGKPTDILVNLDEAALVAETERLEEVLGTLDGILSLKNATVMIEV